MSHRGESLRKLLALLGWLAFALLAPLQWSANPVSRMSGAHAAPTGAMPAMGLHMPMNRLTANACMQLQCHAPPALAVVWEHASPTAKRVLLAPAAPVTLAWSVVPWQRLRVVAAPPVRPEPVLAARPARLLI